MKCPEMSHAAPLGCDMCGKTLTGRMRRWCGRDCEYWHDENHRWTDARQRARNNVRKWVTGVGARYKCARCRKYFPRPDIQVNHIQPCLGKHGTNGCHHHQSNLEVLCKRCHVATTAEQRAAGLLKRAS